MLAQRTLFCLKLLTTPSAPLRNRIFLLRRSHPSLKRRGMGPQPYLNSSPSAETYKVVAGFRPYASFSLDSSACIRRGGCAIKKKMRSHRSGADGVVGIDEVFKNAFLEGVPFSTTINASPYRARASRPSAPLKEASRLLLDVASTHPMSGG